MFLVQKYVRISRPPGVSGICPLTGARVPLTHPERPGIQCGAAIDAPARPCLMQHSRAYKNTRPHGFALPCGPVGVLGVLLGPPFVSIHVPQMEDDVREYMKEDYNEQWVQNGSPPFHTSIIRWFLRFAVSLFSQSLRGGYAPEISSNAPVSRVSSTSSMASIAACIASPRSEA